MKEKLRAGMAPHRILGACNPELAHKALQPAELLTALREHCVPTPLP